MAAPSQPGRRSRRWQPRRGGCRCRSASRSRTATDGRDAGGLFRRRRRWCSCSAISGAASLCPRCMRGAARGARTARGRRTRHSAWSRSASIRAIRPPIARERRDVDSIAAARATCALPRPPRAIRRPRSRAPAGFGYRFDATLDQFAHPAGLLIASAGRRHPRLSTRRAFRPGAARGAARGAAPQGRRRQPRPTRPALLLCFPLRSGATRPVFARPSRGCSRSPVLVTVGRCCLVLARTAAGARMNGLPAQWIAPRRLEPRRAGRRAVLLAARVMTARSRCCLRCWSSLSACATGVGRMPARGSPIVHARALEVGWIAVPLVIFLGMFAGVELAVSEVLCRRRPTPIPCT